MHGDSKDAIGSLFITHKMLNYHALPWLGINSKWFSDNLKNQGWRGGYHWCDIHGYINIMHPVCYHLCFLRALC